MAGRSASSGLFVSKKKRKLVLCISVRTAEYDKKLKMDRAAQLLLSTNMKTYEIASQLGYKSVQHFSRIFMEYYNYTPMEYRQRRNMQ